MEYEFHTVSFIAFLEMRTIYYSLKKSNNYVWVSRSGSKYHSYAGCSGMKNPSKIKKADAVSKGYTACKKCY